jgi:hypothetical protein
MTDRKGSEECKHNPAQIKEYTGMWLYCTHRLGQPLKTHTTYILHCSQYRGTKRATPNGIIQRSLLASTNTISCSVFWMLRQTQATRFITGYKFHLAVQSLFHFKSENRTINYSYTARETTKLQLRSLSYAPLLRSNAAICRQVGHDESLMTHDSDSLLFRVRSECSEKENGVCARKTTGLL